MRTDLSRRTRPSGRGRLLDLACGTGQLAFPLRERFTDAWAVDAECDITNAIRANAAAIEGATHASLGDRRTGWACALDLPSVSVGARGPRP